MTALDEHRAPSTGERQIHKGGHGRLMMLACCVPMLVIAAIVAFSGAGIGFLVVAVMCTAMMAMMMGGMSHDDEDGKSRH